MSWSLDTRTSHTLCVLVLGLHAGTVFYLQCLSWSLVPGQSSKSLALALELRAGALDQPNRCTLSLMALFLLLHRCLGPFYAGFALYKFVANEYLFALLIVAVWFAINLVLVVQNEKDMAWIRQGEQMRLDALREQRDQQHREQWGPWDSP